MEETKKTKTNEKGNMEISKILHMGLIYVVNALYKPIETFKNKESIMEDTKNSFIISGVVAFVMMLINFITTFISTIFVKKFDIKANELKTVLSFDNLKNLNFLELIFKNLIIFFAIIIVLAGIYYIVSLIFKKNVKFAKLLSITAVALIPAVVGTMIVAPILSKIWLFLGIVISIVSYMYAIMTFICLVNQEILIKDSDKRLYFHLVCFTVIAILLYIITTYLLKNAIGNIVGGII